MEFKTPKRIITTTNNKSGDNEDKQTEPPISDNQSDTATLKLNYTEPTWATNPENSYKLTVIKDGKEIQSIDLNGRSKTVFGRIEGCDVRLEHPSISRHHAVLQYKPCQQDKEFEQGFYLYDLGSTHGCKINKNRIPQRTYVRVRTGHLIRFGVSTRLYILESNDGYQAEVELEASREIEDFTKQKFEKVENDDFFSWGIELDSETGTKELSTDGEKDEFYKKDPKKYLKDFFEREGLEMRFDSDQLACGKNRIGFTVKLQLPLEDGNGCPLYAEVTVEGKKREAIKACALEACRMLDASGILRETQYVSSRKRKSAVRAENDYYSSDEDSFLDRTGDLENKREKRLLKARKLSGSTPGEVETYSSLHTKLLAIQSEINELEILIQNTQTKNTQKSNENPDFEEFMKELNSKENTKSVSKLKYKLSQLRSEESRISKLESIVKPVEILGKPISVMETSKNIDGYGLKLAPNNRKQEYLKKTTVVVVDPEIQTNENSEHLQNKNIEKKKIYSVELPPHLKGTFITDTETQQQQQQQQSEDISEEAEYIDWLPPTNQSGDGTTKLNDEFGY